MPFHRPAEGKTLTSDAFFTDLSGFKAPRKNSSRSPPLLTWFKTSLRNEEDASIYIDRTTAFLPTLSSAERVEFKYYTTKCIAWALHPFLLKTSFVIPLYSGLKLVYMPVIPWVVCMSDAR